MLIVKIFVHVVKSVQTAVHVRPIPSSVAKNVKMFSLVIIGRNDILNTVRGPIKGVLFKGLFAENKK